MSTEDIEPTGQGKAEALSSAAIARRHMLLKGVGKGSVVLAATIPIQTLATQTLLTEGLAHQCSVSGMHSGVHSATTTTLTCGGYSPGWWGQSDNATPTVPKHWPTLPNSRTYATTCVTVFTKFNLLNDDRSLPTLFQVMSPKDKSGKFSNTDEFHWICAWLNALSHSFPFPYTGQQVLDFYDSPTTAAYDDALTFFKTYMEAHVS